MPYGITQCYLPPEFTPSRSKLVLDRVTPEGYKAVFNWVVVVSQVSLPAKYDHLSISEINRQSHGRELNPRHRKEYVHTCQPAEFLLTSDLHVCANSADEDFFYSVKTNSAHVLQPYLPDQTNIPYRLRTRPHNITMINKTKFLNDTDVVIRMLYKYS